MFRQAKVAASLIGLSILAACSTTPQVNDLPAALQAASTPADHSRIADYFDAKAANFEKDAAEHGRLANLYERRPAYGNATPPRDYDPRATAGPSMAAHCKRVQASLSDAAREARALAQAHRALAAPAR
jgi:hypothetical protein